jgi:hypothetical protein
MADDRAARPASARRRVGLVVLGALALVLPVGVTSAAWVDPAHFGAAAAGSTFDIWGRFAFDQQWQDVGLPGDPDTFDDGFEIATPPITDVLPGHSYVGDVFLCNAGAVDGRITDATLEEITTSRDGPPTPDLRLVEPLSIEVENIDIGTIIPANSCTASTEADPPNDVEGVIHFTTIDNFVGQYGSTTRIVIKIWVESEPAIAAAGAGAVEPGALFAPTEAAWLDRGGASMEVTAVQEPPPPVSGPVQPEAGTIFAAPTWSGIDGEPNPTPTSSCFRIEIFTTSTDPVPWRVILETDQPPFNNTPPFTIFGFQGRLYSDDILDYNFKEAPDYGISGRYFMDPTSNLQNASSSESHVATVCMESVPQPEWQPPGPQTYTQLPGLVLERRFDQPCVLATVVGHQPYFVGFTVSFNWQTFLDEQLALGAITSTEYFLWRTYTHWGGIPIGFVNSRGATGTDFLVTLQGIFENSRSVSTIAPVTLGACAR